MQPYSKEPVTLIEHVFPGDTNDHDTLFGGKLLSIMDKAGGSLAPSLPIENS